MSAPSRPALRWFGGKWLQASKIIAHFPPHRVYVEPFGGAASVLLQKPPSYAEVYNDLDDEVVNLFRVLRDPETADELARLVALTPFARTEFYAAYEPAEEPVERARRLILRSFMGFGADGATGAYRTGFRANSNRSGTPPAKDWSNYAPAILEIARRFAGVVIEHRPAIEVMRKHDGPETMHYVDPPYIHATRQRTRPGSAYRHEMSDGDHAELLEALLSLRGGGWCFRATRTRSTTRR